MHVTRTIWRRTTGTVVSLIAVMACFIPAVLSAAFSAPLLSVPAAVSRMTGAVVDQPATLPAPCVVLDAGHGGEDGGAVSVNGMTEKELNLSIVLTLGDMLTASGISVVYTRTDDNGLYEGAVPGHRKMTDLRNRLTIRQTYPDALFVSVHMNTFSAPQYSGMQVFYSDNDADSKRLAETVRSLNQTYLQPDNTRTVKAADSSIYLLDRNEGCAILVECGFLSNPGEAASLADPAYRKAVAAVLCAAITDHLYRKGTDSQ